MEKLKQFPVLGTSESNALIFSNRDDEDLSTLHSFGIHSIPHIGVYGQNYSVALPMVLLSLKPTIKTISQVPPNPLAALGIEWESLNSSLLREIARNLVSKVLSSAAKYVDIYFSWRSNRQKSLREAHVDDEEYIKSTIPRLHEDIHVSLSSDYNDSKSTPDISDFKIKNEDITDLSEEQVLRKIAQKLVRKVLHLACTILEPLNRAVSMEELLSNTKKLKVTVSPCSSPLLPMEECFSLPQSSIKPLSGPKDHLNVDSSITHNLLEVSSFSIGSQASSQLLPLKKLGKKRQRSASHEANMDRDLEKIRLGFQTKLQLGNDSLNKELKPGTPATRYPVGHRSIASMVSNLKKMSIMEIEEEKSDLEEDEEEYTILEAITKIEHFDSSSGSDIENSTREVCDGIKSSNDKSVSISLCDVPKPFPSHILSNLDYYIVIHSYPPPSECQKFLCSNTDEINLIFHCWLYKDMPYDPSIHVVENLEMGVFQPDGVSPVHLDLVDSGVPFFYLEPRTVCVHDLCFSPENAQLQLSSTYNKFRSFFSVGCYQNRRVLTFHVVPSSLAVEKELSLILQQSAGSLSIFLDAVSLCQPDLYTSITHLLNPILK